MSSDEEKVDQRQFKVILLGDGAVGKTSIATRFSHDEFTQSYKQTIGLDFFIKHLVLPGAWRRRARTDTVAPRRGRLGPRAAGCGPVGRSRSTTEALLGDIHIAMQLWDIGGQSISSKMLNNYIYGAHAILLCYDITNYESFANLEDWRRAARCFNFISTRVIVELTAEREAWHDLPER